jgi:hypothetical protein
MKILQNKIRACFAKNCKIQLISVKGSCGAGVLASLKWLAWQDILGFSQTRSKKFELKIPKKKAALFGGY